MRRLSSQIFRLFRQSRLLSLSANKCDLKYSRDHEWLAVKNDVATLGISDFAQETLGDIVYVELPEEDLEFEAGDEIGVIESVKSVSNIIAPISGTIIGINQQLTDEPDLVNRSATDEGWICKIKLADVTEVDNLMNLTEYEAFRAEEN